MPGQRRAVPAEDQSPRIALHHLPRLRRTRRQGEKRGYTPMKRRQFLMSCAAAIASPVLPMAQAEMPPTAPMDTHCTPAWAVRLLLREIFGEDVALTFEPRLSELGAADAFWNKPAILA
jgi:hypothetical protein